MLVGWLRKQFNGQENSSPLNVPIKATPPSEEIGGLSTKIVFAYYTVETITGMHSRFEEKVAVWDYPIEPEEAVITILKEETAKTYRSFKVVDKESVRFAQSYVTFSKPKISVTF